MCLSDYLIFIYYYKAYLRLTCGTFLLSLAKRNPILNIVTMLENIQTYNVFIGCPKFIQGMSCADVYDTSMSVKHRYAFALRVYCNIYVCR